MGVMRRVWHHPGWLTALLWLAAQGGVLFPDQGSDIPVTLSITGARDRHGRPVQKWSRVFRFPSPRRFDTFLSYDAAVGRVIDRFGPGRLLAMESVVVWRPDGELRILSTGWSLRLGGARLLLPSRMLGCVIGRQSVDPSSARTMKISTGVVHLLLGEVFGYEGTVSLPDEEPS